MRTRRLPGIQSMDELYERADRLGTSVAVDDLSQIAETRVKTPAGNSIATNALPPRYSQGVDARVFTGPREGQRLYECDSRA